MAPKSGVWEGSGEVYRYHNNTESSHQPEYVEFTAPHVCALVAKVDGVVVVKAWAGAGGAHSWWTAAGGRFLRYPLKPGQTLTVEIEGGAVRMDWYE